MTSKKLRDTVIKYKSDSQQGGRSKWQRKKQHSLVPFVGLATTQNQSVKEKAANVWKSISFVNIVINIHYIKKRNKQQRRVSHEISKKRKR